MHRTRLAALSAGFVALAALPGFAAEPASGTVTDATPVIEWTGGPYVVPNLTPTLGLAGLPVVCEEGTPTCDVFRFEVNLANANPDEDSVVVTVAWGGTATDIGGVFTVPDYDLYLYDDETGDLIIEQASAANPEIITLGVNARKYRLVIIPFAAMNEPYTGKAAFVPFEEDKTLGIFGGAFGAGALLLLAGLGLARFARR